ncbi:MAG: LuxR C-terminal-related transcriptional regulator [Pseudomonadales bacterium]
MSDDVSARRSVLAAMVLFAAIGGLILTDLFVDYRAGGSLLHLAVESGVLLVAVAGIALLWGQLRQSRLDLAQVRGEADRWRREHQQLLTGLGSAIDQQFRRWKLSKAESEVGLLLLKGLSHKEIAGVRNTSERTIREQARALYRKAGLGGRASLSAFFLEDLLLPPDPEVSQKLP